MDTCPDGYEHEEPLALDSTGGLESWLRVIENKKGDEPPVLVGRESYGTGWSELEVTLVKVVRVEGFSPVAVWSIRRRTNIHPKWVSDRSLSTNLTLNGRLWYRKLSPEDLVRKSVRNLLGLYFIDGKIRDRLAEALMDKFHIKPK